MTESEYLDDGSTQAHGIFALRTKAGNIEIDLGEEGSIETRGAYSYGIYGVLSGAQNEGTLSIRTGSGHTVTTTGANGHGIVGYHYGTLDTSIISINVGGSIETTGTGSQGVRVGVASSTDHDMDPATPDISVPQRVATIGADGYRQQTVTVNGPVMGNAAGIFLAGGGKVVIGRRGSVGATSGIAILATGVVPEDATDPNNVIPAIQPKLRVDLNLGGRRVAQALGDNWIINDGGETTIKVNGVVLHDGKKGVKGSTASNGAWNVRMREEGVAVDRTQANWRMSEPTAGVVVVADRDFSAQDFNERRKPPPPPSPPPPPMRQPVMVDERVFGGPDDPAGVLLEGDGEVYIGPEGSVGAESGIAILAMGDSRELLVDMNLNGRRVAEVIGDDWIINDGGETTIVVNDVTLHKGATGVVPDAVGLNGAWNVRMRAESVTVTDYTTDPANWIVSELATGVIADRDFSAEDFIEEMRGQPESPMFMEEYAPRAAVYEALPDFLLRLTGQGPSRTCGSVPDEPVWVRFAGGQGSYEADRSTTGATYNLERFETEGGLSAAFNDTTKGWVSVRHVWGCGRHRVPDGRRADRRAGAGLLGGRRLAEFDRGLRQGLLLLYGLHRRLRLEPTRPAQGRHQRPRLYPGCRGRAAVRADRGGAVDPAGLGGGFPG